MRPLVSIIIPTYNHAHFLKNALESVINQTYTHWEALIVDNHSEDNTSEVIASFNDPRVKKFMIHNNGVISASRNLGLKEARGEWVAFLDSDDIWYPEKLSTIISYLQENDSYDVYCTDEVMVNLLSGKRQILRFGPYKKNFYKKLLIDGNCLSPSATIIKREFMQRHNLFFDESHEYITVEDYDLWLNMARLDARFKFIHSIQGEYVIHSANNSGINSRHSKNYELLLHNHVYTIQQFEPIPDKLWNQILMRFRFANALQLARSKKYGKALRLIAADTVRNPFRYLSFLVLRLKSMATAYSHGTK